MLGILLSILKILGIILLAVLAVVLLAVLVLLFVPVRYRISGKWNTEEKKIEGKVTWLFRLVHISMSADKNGQQIVPRIMGINLKKSRKKKQKPKKEERNKRKKRKKKKEKNLKEDNQGENNSEEKNLKEGWEKKETEKKVEKQKEEGQEERMDNKENTDWQQEKQKSIFQKIYEKIISVLSAISKIAQTWKKLLENLQELQKKKDKIFDFFCEKEALEAKDKTFKIVKKTIRHIRPQKLKTSVRFGVGNPAYTGQLYALLCLMYGIYGKDIILEPDFEHTILEGEFQLKGRIRLINLIYYMIYLYRIKKLREFIELLKNL